MVRFAADVMNVGLKLLSVAKLVHLHPLQWIYPVKLFEC